MEVMNTEMIQDLATTLNLLGDPIRLSIVTYLIDEPSTVGKIAKDLLVSQPLVSHHLRVLKNSRIVKATKYGKNVLYTLIDMDVKNLIKNALNKGVN